ncbi:hypothetical protein SAY86_012617 [Trapa natans]|uniref:S-adenosyl-L-methionine-dependent methyltransferase n=1 Tax=Trapa natans TaxID=22666 RepID=A0AAN7LSG2_TRANT|nr:hypothetical protein SAY86_012617 [Trapa natans]
MAGHENGAEQPPSYPELELPELLLTDAIRELHSVIENQWDPLRLSACQTAAGRALWKHAVNDPLAGVLAGETYLRRLHEKMKNDHLNNAREVSGVILAVRTLWFDSKIEAAISSFRKRETQVVMLGAGMDARAYRLSCLKDSEVFEVDFNDVLQVKTTLIEAAGGQKPSQLIAKSVTRVAADIREEAWFEKLKQSGYKTERNTVWVLEGILYYLSPSQAMKVLNIIAGMCDHANTVLLADFMNKPSTMLSNSIFQFYSDWPEHLLPSLGLPNVKLSQIGDPDANFGLMNDDPINLFNKLRSLPRTLQINPEDGTPCRRLYLVQASSSPIQDLL